MAKYRNRLGAETLPERIESGRLCITDLFQNKISPKKTGFPPPKKNILPFFFDHKKLKKPPQKDDRNT